MPGPVDIRAQAATVTTGMNSLIPGTLDAGELFRAMDYTRPVEEQPASGLDRAFSVRMDATATAADIASSTQIDHESTLEVAIGYRRRKPDDGVLDMLGRDTVTLLDRMARPANYAAATTGIVLVSPGTVEARDLDADRRVAYCRWPVRYRLTRV